MIGVNHGHRGRDEGAGIPREWNSERAAIVELNRGLS